MITEQERHLLATWAEAILTGPVKIVSVGAIALSAEGAWRVAQYLWEGGYAVQPDAEILTHGSNADCPEVQSGAWKRCLGHRA